LAIHQLLNLMQEEQLKTADSEDIDDSLGRVESSFGIKFGANELQYTKTFGELCGIIESKILLPSVSDCTSQQAFYKLRQALAVSTGASGITPDSPLYVILPSRGRKAVWRSVEQQLGFQLAIIGPSSLVKTVVAFAFLVSLLALFISAKVAGISLLVSCLAAFIADKTSNTLQVKILQECVHKMTREQYLMSRRNSGTVNRQEIFRQVQEIFMDGLGLPAAALGWDATFRQ
jgi:hypothetical protein